MTSRHGISLTEALVSIAALACMVACVVTILPVARDASARSSCALNLARIGTGLRLYAHEHDGYLPDCGAASPLGGAVPVDGRHVPSRADAPGTTAWPATRAVGNQANLWVLVREQYVDARLFVCPATADRPTRNPMLDHAVLGFLELDPETAAPSEEEERFLRRVAGGRCSYSYQNQFAHPATSAAVTPAVNARTNTGTHPDDLPVVADRNPFTRVDGTRQPVVSPDEEPEANSLNHGGAGQNVLYLSGRVAWHETPFCGPVRAGGVRDNLYWPDEGRPDDPHNVPRDRRDAFLVP